MVSHWILSDSKSPQVSKILLIILADLNNAVVWMVSYSSSYVRVVHSLYQSFGDSNKRTHYIIVTCMFHSFFFQFCCKVLLFGFFQFYSVGCQRLGDHLYFKIPEVFVRLIFQDELWVVHYTICSYSQIQISCTISSGPSLPTQSSPYLEREET